jgi:hypothetical protein
MIRTEWLRDGEVLAIHPEGAIDEADFRQVGDLVDPVIAAKGRLEGLLIDARGFAGWDDARALVAHMRFVSAHQANVARIAALGDQWWLKAALAMEPLFGATIRVFAAAEEDAAKAWLVESPPAPATITFLPESQGDLIAIRVTGRLRDADYDSFKAELTRRAPETGKLRLLVIMDEGFRGWTPKACFDDIALAFSSWSRRFGKLAVVSGPGLVHWCTAHFPSAIMPYEIRAFTPEEQDAALAWLRD